MSAACAVFIGEFIRGGLAAEIFATITYTSLAIAGSLGNILLIVVICRTPSLRTVCGVLISNVAVADLMVTSLVMPMLVFLLAQGFLQQCISATAGLVVLLTVYFSASASLLTLAILSMDRWLVICYPLKHKVWVTFTTAKVVLVITWIDSLMLPLLQIFYPGSLVTSYFQTLGVGVCYFAITISGVLTLRKVRANSRQIGSLHLNQGRNSIAADLQQRNKQVAKTIAIVVAVFSLCWIPFAVGIRLHEAADNRHLWFATSGFANSTVTPWIYFYRQANYRQALKMLLGSCKTKRNIAVRPNGSQPE